MSGSGYRTLITEAQWSPPLTSDLWCVPVELLGGGAQLVLCAFLLPTFLHMELHSSELLEMGLLQAHAHTSMLEQQPWQPLFLNSQSTLTPEHRCVRGDRGSAHRIRCICKFV